MRLEAAIKRAIPGAVVTGSVGRSQSFEVTVDGVLVYSKLQSGTFPDESTVVSKLMAKNPKTAQACQRPPPSYGGG